MRLNWPRWSWLLSKGRLKLGPQMTPSLASFELYTSLIPSCQIVSIDLKQGVCMHKYTYLVLVVLESAGSTFMTYECGIHVSSQLKARSDLRVTDKEEEIEYSIARNMTFLFSLF